VTSREGDIDLLALVILMAVVLGIVVVLVIGLLRTHAEVLRRLHELGAGIYDETPAPRSDAPTLRDDLAQRVAAGVAPPGDALDSLPADLVGVDPRGDAVHVGVAGEGRLTLLAFLSTGCTTCAGFWDAFHEGRSIVLDGGARPRVVVVTKGPENEQVNAVAARPPLGGTVVMSTDAWTDYRVPASPYFVLIDGRHGVVGEGSAASFAQLSGLLDRATADLGVVAPSGRAGARGTEERIDLELLRAGITPGHESLYRWTEAGELDDTVELSDTVELNETVEPSEERTGA
jgi:hypothetical protein